LLRCYVCDGIGMALRRQLMHTEANGFEPTCEKRLRGIARLLARPFAHWEA